MSRWPNGDVHSGLWKKSKRDGYGYMKYRNGDEYDGLWKDDKKNGTGFFKDGATREFKMVLDEKSLKVEQKELQKE